MIAGHTLQTVVYFPGDPLVSEVTDSSMLIDKIFNLKIYYGNISILKVILLGNSVI